MDLDEADQLFLDALVQRAATATCDAVADCCAAPEIELFFGGMANHPRLDAIADRLPPNAPLDVDTCPDLIAEAYQAVSLGSWIAAAEDGFVEFDIEAATTCLDALEAVACDESFAEAFFSGQCFGFTPPYGAGQQRVSFGRIGNVGDDCIGLTDGAGGAFFGTCNPANAWCAQVQGEATRIVPDGENGTCVAASGVGDPCGFVFTPGSPSTFQVCQQGLECNLENECSAPNVGAIAMGDACYDSGEFTLLGDCVDSYCDILGTNECLALKDDGAACTDSFQCGSAFCNEGRCTVGQFCDGEG